MDVILRISTATVLFVMVLALLARPSPWRWTLCFIAMALGTSTYVMFNGVTDEFIPAPWSWPWLIANLMGKTIVISVWLFVQSSFDDEFRFDRFRIGVSLVWLGLILNGNWRLKMGIEGPFDFATVTMALILMGHLIWTLLQGRDDDLRLGRRMARIWVSVIMVSLLLLDLMIDLTLGFSWRPAGYVYVQNGLILFAALALFLTIIRIDITAIAPKLSTNDRPNHQLSEHAEKLHQIMNEAHLYLRSELRLSDIVAQLPTSEAATRSLIHDEFGHGHFRSFLNRYRIKHAQELMRSPDHKASKLIAIAFDSGFASLASFQRAFKRETGQTASEWRAEQ